MLPGGSNIIIGMIYDASWVGSELHRSCITSHNGRLGSSFSRSWSIWSIRPTRETLGIRVRFRFMYRAPVTGLLNPFKNCTQGSGANYIKFVWDDFVSSKKGCVRFSVPGNAFGSAPPSDIWRSASLARISNRWYHSPQHYSYRNSAAHHHKPESKPNIYTRITLYHQYYSKCICGRRANSSPNGALQQRSTRHTTKRRGKKDVQALIITQKKKKNTHTHTHTRTLTYV